MHSPLQHGSASWHSPRKSVYLRIHGLVHIHIFFESPFSPSRDFYTSSTLTAHTLYSGILATGSNAAMVSSFADASGKWKLAYTMPGGTRSVIQASASMLPLRELTLTRLRPFKPKCRASSGFTSISGSEYIC